MLASLPSGSALPRVALAWLLLGAAGALASGCGSNAATASGAGGGEHEARVFAGEVNLRAPDAPGFKVELASGGEDTAPPGPLPRQVEECDGGPVVDGASRGVPSALLQKQTVPIQTVLSVVYPMRDPLSASSYLRAADSRRGRGCLQRAEARKRAALSGKAEVVALRPPLGGASVSGVRVWKCLAGPQACKRSSSRSFTDRLWLAAGPYVVELAYIAGARNEAKGPAAVALPVERRLVALLSRRALAHKP